MKPNGVPWELPIVPCHHQTWWHYTIPNLQLHVWPKKALLHCHLPCPVCPVLCWTMVSHLAESGPVCLQSSALMVRRMLPLWTKGVSFVFLQSALRWLCSKDPYYCKSHNSTLLKCPKINLTKLFKSLIRHSPKEMFTLRLTHHCRSFEKSRIPKE